MNSPQSQKLAVGSIVIKYTVAAIAKTSIPVILSVSRNVFIFYVLFFNLTANVRKYTDYATYGYKKARRILCRARFFL
jgi:hypothetical protein